MLVALGACLAAVSGWRYARASAPVNGPIVLVSVDALRADHLPPYGYRGVHTPAIDALAADGIVFERAYAHVPQTLPAHAALLTGRLPFETGVRDGVGFTLKESERTLPEMLGDRGYSTAGMVSSFLLRKDSGIGQGFAFFDADLTDVAKAGPPPLVRDAAATEKIAEHWMDSAGTSRLFLFLHLGDLYQPYGPDAQEGSGPAAAYDAGIARADEALGQFVHYLKTHQLYDRSTIVLVGDHGEGLGDHGEQGHGLFAYEEALHVPLIVKQPGAEGAGRRVPDLVQQIDIVPTILDLARAPIPGNLRGRSLTPLFSGDTRETMPVYSESLYGHYHFGWGAISTVTDGRYRFIKAPREELYDLKSDPGEQHNLVDERPDIAGRLRASLKNLAAEGPLPKMEPVSEADRGRLEALGYVGTIVDASSATEPEDAKDWVPVVERYRVAAAEAAAGHWDAAIERYRALLQEEPALPDLWIHLAAAARHVERFELAGEAFKRAALLAPDNPEAHLGAGFALLRLRKLDESRIQAQQVLDTPRVTAIAQATAHELLARVALARRDVERARSEATLAEKADALRPVTAFVEGRIAFDRRRYTDALASFEEALAATEKTPDRHVADLRVLAAESLLALDRYSEAEYLFEQELEDAPSSRALAGLTAVYRATGRTDEASTLTTH